MRSRHPAARRAAAPPARPTNRSKDSKDRVIANLLDLSRLQAGALKPVLRPVGVDEVVARALLAHPGAVHVDVRDDLPLVDADPGLFERVVANLVDNAARHTAPGTQVRVARRRRPHEHPACPVEDPPLVPDAVVVQVIDHGPGVPESQWEHLFVPFQRLDDSSEAGLGLGLAIADGFTRAMGGRLSPSRTPGGGLTMSVVLPARPHRERVSRTPGCADDRSRILLVDDAALVRTLSISLRARGYDVQTCRDGRSALTQWRQAAADLVVVDLGLPDLDGVAVVRGVRAGSPVPILVLSARHGEAEKVLALDAGADDYVTKPFGLEELLARVRAALRRQEPKDGGPQMDADRVVRTSSFVIDLAAQHVMSATGTTVRLTPTEWHVLEVLARTPGDLIGQRQLLQEVWGPAYGSETNYLRVNIAQLRCKLETDPARPRHILTEPGRGYRLTP